MGFVGGILGGCGGDSGLSALGPASESMPALRVVSPMGSAALRPFGGPRSGASRRSNGAGSAWRDRRPNSTATRITSESEVSAAAAQRLIALSISTEIGKLFVRGAMIMHGLTFSPCFNLRHLATPSQPHVAIHF